MEWSGLTTIQQNTAFQVAVEVLNRFRAYGQATQKTMIAIACAESNLNPQARGDIWMNMSGENRTRGQAVNCDDYCSFGIWQIFMAWHWDKIVAEGGPDPRYQACAAASWLYNIPNATRVAYRIYNSQGIGAWSAYNNDTYIEWLPVATQALFLAIEDENEEPPPPAELSMGLPILLAGFALMVVSFLWKRK